jgi:hypothetical protein
LPLEIPNTFLTESYRPWKLIYQLSLDSFNINQRFIYRFRYTKRRFFSILWSLQEDAFLQILTCAQSCQNVKPDLLVGPEKKSIWKYTFDSTNEDYDIILLTNLKEMMRDGDLYLYRRGDGHLSLSWTGTFFSMLILRYYFPANDCI